MICIDDDGGDQRHCSVIAVKEWCLSLGLGIDWNKIELKEEEKNKKVAEYQLGQKCLHIYK